MNFIQLFSFYFAFLSPYYTYEISISVCCSFTSIAAKQILNTLTPLSPQQSALVSHWDFLRTIRLKFFIQVSDSFIFSGYQNFFFFFNDHIFALSTPYCGASTDGQSSEFFPALSHMHSTCMHLVS